MWPRPTATLPGARHPSIWPSAAFQLGRLPPGLHAPTCRSFRRGSEGASAQPGTEAAEEGGTHSPAALRPLWAFVSLLLPFCLFCLSPPHPVSGLFLPSAPCFPFLDPVSVCPCHRLSPAPHLCLHPCLASIPCLVASLFFCLHLLLADFSLHHHRLEGQDLSPTTQQQRHMTNTCQ